MQVLRSVILTFRLLPLVFPLLCTEQHDAAGAGPRSKVYGPERDNSPRSPSIGSFHHHLHGHFCRNLWIGSIRACETWRSQGQYVSLWLSGHQ